MNDTTFQADGKVAYLPVVVSTKEPKLTNADRIRSMKDEELAGFISMQIIDRNIGVPVESWLDWLKQEVEEGE